MHLLLEFYENVFCVSLIAKLEDSLGSVGSSLDIIISKIPVLNKVLSNTLGYGQFFSNFLLLQNRGCMKLIESVFKKIVYEPTKDCIQFTEQKLPAALDYNRAHKIAVRDLG